MTGYVAAMGGGMQALPPLLQWQIERTDGEPCGAFRVQFAFEPEMLARLKLAARFYAEHEGRRVMTGVVDDVTVMMGKDGLLAELTGRSLAALLLDTQVRAAEYQSAQLPDILAQYVKPCGVTDIVAEAMPAVGSFVVETGYSCYQVLAGFCRHSADVLPRFDANGALILKRGGTGVQRVIRGGVVRAQYCFDRYGAAVRQVLVNTRNGSQKVAQNEEFLAMGGSGVRVAGVTGQKIRAAWRTAEQRLSDSWRNARMISLTLPGSFLAEPTDTVLVELPELGVGGTFTVRSAVSSCDDSGAVCTLELRE